MGVSKNYAKQIYQASDLGKLEAKIRRFYNIKSLAEAFDKSPEGLKVRKLRDENEKGYIALAEKQGKVEQELIDLKKKHEKDIEELLKVNLTREVEIITAFEKNFNN